MEKVKRTVICFIVFMLIITSFAKAQTPIYEIVPLIIRANLEIKKDRLDLQNGTNINQLIIKYKLYNYSKYNNLSKTINSLEYRIQPLPVSLVLAVFILETGNGTNRFYYQYNSLFSEKYYKNGKVKIKPFKSRYEAIKSFLLLINTNSAYASLRHNRRVNISGINLAQYLTNYSKTKDYPLRIKNIIIKDKLEEFDN